MPAVFAFLGAISLLVVIISSFIPLFSADITETYKFFIPVYALFGTLMVSSFALFITSSLGAGGHGGHEDHASGHDAHSGGHDSHAAAPAHDSHGHH